MLANFLEREKLYLMNSFKKKVAPRKVDVAKNRDASEVNRLNTGSDHR